ncbi:hypothetical protein DCAR_0313135 [Daucus carota subsp. sativus]|uniref:AT-hook motif nuclear-localized protein n=1 Tax=Daucus carota subsp. sativus TaxID=79200 RepID=A0A166BTY6_DAUCS|nr:PREDICTED: AT-hook motif nuclear-localized protein 10-like [Daucus carota subsp. sativus]WOG93848.1 hypothetical protein DCAR_0313135 [Daucus carota subsp. sativus]
MSSIENAAAVAKIQESPAPNPVNIADAAPNDGATAALGASVVHAPPPPPLPVVQTPPPNSSEPVAVPVSVSVVVPVAVPGSVNQPESVVVPAPAAVPVSVFQPGSVVVPAPAAVPVSVFQPESVVVPAPAVVPVSVFQPESVVVHVPAQRPTAAELVSQPAAERNGVVARRKRGRPRKYTPVNDQAIVAVSPVPAAAVTPVPAAAVTPVPATAVTPVPPTAEQAQTGGGSSAADAQARSGKRGRGRPVGSRNKAPSASRNVNPAVSGSAGMGFTPHIIVVQPGMDVLARLVSFSQVRAQTVCVLSATGSIASVTLQQSSGSGMVTYEGRFEILSLVGSFLVTESGIHQGRTGGLSVSLAAPDGSVLGGRVAGLLIAASPVQVIVGTFNEANQQAMGPGSNGSAPPRHVSSVGGSPPSRATMGESSGGPVTPFNPSTGGYNNVNQQNVSNVGWN